MSGCWIFQANPEKYDIDTELRTLDVGDWTVRRYQNRVQPGDLVFVWKSSPRRSIRGIYAAARIRSGIKVTASPPELGGNLFRKASDNKVEPRVEIEYLKKLSSPILVEDIRGNPALRNLLVLRQPNATNFALSDSECAEIRRLLGV
jgi:predicted RNA-binding protein with PUA-like domain